jgi:hypothetical protein
MIGDSIVHRIMHEVGFSSMAAMSGLTSAEVLDGAWARLRIDDPIVSRIMCQVCFSSGDDGRGVGRGPGDLDGVETAGAEICGETRIAGPVWGSRGG